MLHLQSTNFSGADSPPLSCSLQQAPDLEVLIFEVEHRDAEHESTDSTKLIIV